MYIIITHIVKYTYAEINVFKKKLIIKNNKVV